MTVLFLPESMRLADPYDTYAVPSNQNETAPGVFLTFALFHPGGWQIFVLQWVNGKTKLASAWGRKDVTGTSSHKMANSHKGRGKNRQPDVSKIAALQGQVFIEVSLKFHHRIPKTIVLDCSKSQRIYWDCEEALRGNPSQRDTFPESLA